MIAAVIFDMDGVLVDSEPLWRRAEVEVFAEYGLVISEDDCKATMGLRLDDVIRFRFPHFAPAESLRAEERVLDRVVALVSSEGEPKSDAARAVDYVRARGLPVALASSSPLRLIRATLDRLGLSDRFRVIHSAESEPFGKPHPAVYLTTAERLGVRPESCLAIEDSLRGLVSAKAASMRCIAVPEDHDPHPGFALADLTLKSLRELDDAAWASLDPTG